MKAAVPRITRSAPARQRVAHRAAASAGRRRTGPARAARGRSARGGASDLRRAGARAVEVDDVQEARAGVDPRARGLQRRVARRRSSRRSRPARGARPARRRCRSPGRGSLRRRHRTRAQIRVKFASSARPAAEDFSGWNCTPKTLPRRDDGRERARRSRRAEHVVLVGRARRRTSARGRRRAGRGRPVDAAATGASSATSFQPMCGSFSPPRVERARPRRAAARGPSVAAELVGARRTAAACRGRRRAPARRRRARSTDELVEAELAQVAASPAGTRRRRARTSPSAARSASWSPVSTTSAPTRSSAFSTERRLPIP